MFKLYFLPFIPILPFLLFLLAILFRSVAPHIRTTPAPDNPRQLSSVAAPQALLLTVHHIAAPLSHRHKSTATRSGVLYHRSQHHNRLSLPQLPHIQSPPRPPCQHPHSPYSSTRFHPPHSLFLLLECKPHPITPAAFDAPSPDVLTLPLKLGDGWTLNQS